MRGLSKILVAIALLLAAGPIEPGPSLAECTSGMVCTCPPTVPLEAGYRRGRWFVLKSENFQICCDDTEEKAQALARHAEALRTMLQSKWLGKTTVDAWHPRCEIVLHATQPSYVAAVGQGSERTVGSSLVDVGRGRIVARRIDLLGGRTEFLSAALPHELTHVVLRERFMTAPLPRWADEGAAILHDPPAKQARHRSDLYDAWAQRALIPTADLLTMEGYPGADRMGVFYGQSAAVAQFLVGRKGPARFVEFIERAVTAGYDAALQECYGIANIRELDRLWRRDQQATAGAATVGG